MYRFVVSKLLAVVLLSGATSGRAGDWPQILGPNRNGIAEDESITNSLPESGPPVVWDRAVGRGFAGLAVADGRAVLFHRVDDREVVEMMDAKTGTIQWKKAIPTDYRPTVVRDDGPRCVPLIHDGRVYVFGVQGGLRCLDLATGEQVWSRATHREYNAPEGYFGAGSTPILEDGKLLVNVGGRGPDSGIVAFDADTGETVWQVREERASYSSPVAVTVDGVRHAIFVTRYNTVSLDPGTGETRFEFPFGKRGPTVNGASPVVMDKHLFVTAAYGVGAVFARLEKDDAEILWKSDQILSSQYTTCIADGGSLYGIDGRQDLGVADLKCIHPQSKSVEWTETGFGYATLIEADGKLLILKTDGTLVLANPDPEQYRELDRVSLFEGTCRALPALADGYFYARDEDTLKCFDLRPRR